MKIRPVKTAVIGCGMISDKYFKNIKEKFSILDLVGCSDLVEEKARAQAEKYGIRAMTNDEILGDPEIELVLNLTYASAHFEVNRAILSAGKHCYSEKMMCLDMEQAGILRNLATERGVYFGAAPDTFLGASQQTARFAVDRGLIGVPLSATVELCRGYFMIKSDADDAKRKYSVMAEGGGIPYDMGGYYLHALFNIFGPVRRVCGFMTTRNQTRPYLNPRNSHFEDPFFVNTENTLCASLAFDAGVLCNIMISSDHAAYHQSFAISGTEGRLTCGDPNNFGDKLYLTRHGADPVELPLFHPYSAESRGIGAAEMAWAIRRGRPPRLSLEMSYHALEVLCAIKRSSLEGITVTLQTDFPRPDPISTEFYDGQSLEWSLGRS